MVGYIHQANTQEMHRRELVRFGKFTESYRSVEGNSGTKQNSSLSSSLNKIVGGAGAWPLADRKVSTNCPYL